MADDDVNDSWEFSLQPSKNGLAVEAGELTLRFAPAALESARSFAVLSQGAAVSSSHGPLPKLVKKDLPPFLLSKKVLAELGAKGKSRLRPEWGEEPVELSVVAKGTAKLAGLSLSVLDVAGDDVAFRVVDDAAFPLVLEREEGDAFWRLRKLDGRAVKLAFKLEPVARPAPRGAVGTMAKEIALALDKNAPEDQRLAAVQALGKATDAASLRALLEVHAWGGSLKVVRACHDPFVARSSSPDFIPLVESVLSMSPKNGKQRELVSALLNLVASLLEAKKNKALKPTLARLKTSAPEQQVREFLALVLG